MLEQKELIGIAVKIKNKKISSNKNKKKAPRVGPLINLKKDVLYNLAVLSTVAASDTGVSFTSSFAGITIVLASVGHALPL